MKKKSFFDRIIGVSSGGDTLPPPIDDPGFFATQFMERPESVRAKSAWAARALVVGAQSFSSDEGFQALEKAWGGDHFFAALDRGERKRLSSVIEFVTVPAGREVIVQEERGDYALVVLEGVVAVDRAQPAGGRARLAEAREGDLLGEMSLLDAGSRFASCLTLTSCKLAVLTTEALDDLSIEEPRVGMAVMASVARRLSLRTRQLSGRLGALLVSG
ncbi:MAG: Crp/Fnr family transcriptional regulator [Pseudomonadota bacterium]|jgi:CRP/FNR family transcriptional regulator, cyclic AMP receptor protein|uniref:Crp/Fnr family transcriptional regulator n=1 Tax=Aquabacterium sp. TaxID=1872578 RepID=UPI003BB08EC6